MNDKIRTAIKELATPARRFAYQNTTDKFVFADDLLVDHELDARRDPEATVDTITREHERRVELLELYLEEPVEGLQVDVILTGPDGEERNLQVFVTMLGELENYAAALVRDRLTASFRFGSMRGDYPSNDPGNLQPFASELNRISRFGKWGGNVATAR